MAKYLIPDFCEMESPIIENLMSSFKLGDEFVKVTGTLVDKQYRFEPVEFGQMPNTDNWGDADVLEFAQQQLEKFKVNG